MYVISLLLALGVGVGAGTGTAVYVTGNVVEDQHHTDCLHGNESRAALREAFGKLVDTFVTNSSPASQPRIRSQGDAFLAELAKGLPIRRC